MKRFVIFWKQDLINKLIVVISLLLAAGVIAFLYLIANIPEGKSLRGAFSEIIPLPSTSDVRSVFTNTPEAMTPTALPFNLQRTPTTAAFNTLSTLPSTPTPAQVLATPTLEIFTSTPTPGTTPVISINNECIPNASPQAGKVVDVIDGNTVKALVNDLVYVVRYIGVAAPEDKMYSEAARLENAKLVFGKEITLFADVSDKDPRGRLLRYVMVGDTFVNLKLVQQGLASALDIPPDSSCALAFKQTEQSAINAQLGKWIATSTQPSP